MERANSQAERARALGVKLAAFQKGDGWGGRHFQAQYREAGRGRAQPIYDFLGLSYANFTTAVDDADRSGSHLAGMLNGFLACVRSALSVLRMRGSR